MRTDEALSTTNCATSKGLVTTTTATCTFIANSANAPSALTACNCRSSTCPKASAPTTFHSSSKVCVPNASRGSAKAEYTQARNSSTNGGDASRVGKRRNKELNPTLSTDAGRVAPIRDRLPHRHNKKAHSEMLVRACGMRFLFCNFKSHATRGCDLKSMNQTFTPEAKTSLP